MPPSTSPDLLANGTPGSARLLSTVVSWPAVGRLPAGSSGNGALNTTGRTGAAAGPREPMEVTPAAAPPMAATAAAPRARVFQLTAVLSIGSDTAQALSE